MERADLLPLRGPFAAVEGTAENLGASRSGWHLSPLYQQGARQAVHLRLQGGGVGCPGAGREIHGLPCPKWSVVRIKAKELSKSPKASPILGLQEGGRVLRGWHDDSHRIGCEKGVTVKGAWAW